MADETKKTTTTPKKRTTTSKPKVEEPKPTSIEEQMAQMMAMMMAQQQQIMELMAKSQQVDDIEDDDLVIKEKPKTKRQRKDDRPTKQDLRRKYKGIDIYVTNITQGTVIYQGKNMAYEWKHTGDVEVVAIEDIINMPKRYLNEPWLVIDSYENAEEIINDIVEALKLEQVYEYIDTIQDMQEHINDVSLEEIERAIKLSQQRDCDITLDLVVLVQKKIESKELTNYHMIGELQKLLGRKFL